MAFDNFYDWDMPNIGQEIYTLYTYFRILMILKIEACLKANTFFKLLYIDILLL